MLKAALASFSTQTEVVSVLFPLNVKDILITFSVATAYR